MSDLHKALGDISIIRKQMALSTEFRGYGPVTVACTGMMAVVTAIAQAVYVPDPVSHTGAYVGLWSATAVLSAGLTAVQVYTRSRRMHSGMSDEMVHMAAEQLLPAVAAGFLMTFVLLRYVPQVLWMLPGLWQVIFGLGVFASCRFLPRPMLAAGAWYLIAGLASITLGDARAFAPWVMGSAFGVGQFLVATVLRLTAQENELEA